MNTTQKRQMMEEILKAFIEGFSPVSDIVFNEDLAKVVLGHFTFDEFRKQADEYVIRRHLRDVMRMYLTEVHRSRKIQVKDKEKFGFQLEAIGLNLDHPKPTWNVPPHAFPDGLMKFCNSHLQATLL